MYLSDPRTQPMAPDSGRRGRGERLEFTFVTSLGDSGAPWTLRTSSMAARLLVPDSQLSFSPHEPSHFDLEHLYPRQPCSEACHGSHVRLRAG